MVIKQIVTKDSLDWLIEAGIDAVRRDDGLVDLTVIREEDGQLITEVIEFKPTDWYGVFGFMSYPSRPPRYTLLIPVAKGLFENSNNQEKAIFMLGGRFNTALGAFQKYRDIIHMIADGHVTH